MHDQILDLSTVVTGKNDYIHDTSLGPPNRGKSNNRFYIHKYFLEFRRFCSVLRCVLLFVQRIRDDKDFQIYQKILMPILNSTVLDPKKLIFLRFYLAT